MRLNPDLYYDLAWEFISLGDEDMELMASFMLWGKGSIGTLKHIVNRVNKIFYYKLWNSDNNRNYKHCPYVIELVWDNNVMVQIDLEDPLMRLVIRWALSSVKKIEVFCDKPLPTDAMELLLTNQNFTELLLYYNLPTVNILVESRQFDYISMPFSAVSNLNDIRIVTKTLELTDVSLENILKVNSISTKSLGINYLDENFNNSLLTMNINPEFESLECLKLTVSNRHSYFDSKKMLKFLEFLNTKLTNLKFLIFNLYEPYNGIYFNNQGNFDTSPSFIKNRAKYDSDLNVYNGRVKVILTRYIKCDVFGSPETALENYIKKLRMKLQDYEYSWIKGKTNYFYFEKSGSLVENFKFTTQIRLSYCI
ncbi:hypothetical protein FO519_009366 [Halicephalobus sp. NKZ332]|nr:hypothetical protein FO519_009366 [Halicephalobus sp. NKZ332]